MSVINVNRMKFHLFARVCQLSNKTRDHSIYTVDPLFVSDCVENKERLVLVSTAGSATASSLELPALGADVGPRKEKE